MIAQIEVTSAKMTAVRISLLGKAVWPYLLTRSADMPRFATAMIPMATEAIFRELQHIIAWPLLFCNLQVQPSNCVRSAS